MKPFLFILLMMCPATLCMLNCCLLIACHDRVMRTNSIKIVYCCTVTFGLAISFQALKAEGEMHRVADCFCKHGERSNTSPMLHSEEDDFQRVLLSRLEAIHMSRYVKCIYCKTCIEVWPYREQYPVEACTDLRGTVRDQTGGAGAPGGWTPAV